MALILPAVVWNVISGRLQKFTIESLCIVAHHSSSPLQHLGQFAGFDRGPLQIQSEASVGVLSRLLTNCISVNWMLCDFEPSISLCHAFSGVVVTVNVIVLTGITSGS